MGNLAIKDDIISELTRVALTRGQKAEDLAEQFLRVALSQNGVHVSLRERAEAIAALTPKDVKQTDSTLLIREDRDR